MLKIAIQKSGRLYEDSVSLLRDCGIELPGGTRQLIARSPNFPIELLFLRDDDIPQYVQDGVADIGIVGENVCLEANCRVNPVVPLGFGKCRLSLAVPKSMKYENVTDLSGKRIATSYPNLLRRFFQEHAVQADIHPISGSVEIAPGIGLADAICDLVSSGSTLLTNGLKEVDVVLQSEAILISNEQLSDAALAILSKLLLRIKAVNASRCNKYILLNAPNHRLPEIIRLLPGMKSPTIVPLATEGWSSVQSVVNENEFWEVIEKLQEYEAQGILVMPIEKMVL